MSNSNDTATRSLGFNTRSVHAGSRLSLRTEATTTPVAAGCAAPEEA